MRPVVAQALHHRSLGMGPRCPPAAAKRSALLTNGRARATQAARFMDACAHGGMVTCEAQLAAHVLQLWNTQATAAAAPPAAPPAGDAPAAAEPRYPLPALMLPLPPVAGSPCGGAAQAAGEGGAGAADDAASRACSPLPGSEPLQGPPEAPGQAVAAPAPGAAAAAGARAVGRQGTTMLLAPVAEEQHEADQEQHSGQQGLVEQQPQLVQQRQSSAIRRSTSSPLSSNQPPPAATTTTVRAYHLGGCDMQL